jgi:hypothetical protein
MSTPDPAHVAPLTLLSPLARDRLFRLRDALERRRSAEQLLHGEALATARALLARAIFTLYLDCREAGAGEEARLLLAAAGLAHPTPGGADPAPDPPPAASAHALRPA